MDCVQSAECREIMAVPELNFLLRALAGGKVPAPRISRSRQTFPSWRDLFLNVDARLKRACSKAAATAAEISMNNPKADHLREMAATCRAQASCSSVPGAAEAFAKMAADYEASADKLETRVSPPRPTLRLRV